MAAPKYAGNTAWLKVIPKQVPLYRVCSRQIYTVYPDIATPGTCRKHRAIRLPLIDPHHRLAEFDVPYSTMLDDFYTAPRTCPCERLHDIDRIHQRIVREVQLTLAQDLRLDT